MATTYQESVVGLQQLASHTAISAKKLHRDSALAGVSTTNNNNTICHVLALVRYQNDWLIIQTQNRKTKQQKVRHRLKLQIITVFVLGSCIILQDLLLYWSYFFLTPFASVTPLMYALYFVPGSNFAFSYPPYVSPSPNTNFFEAFKDFRDKLAAT